jgi:hypothetical protein
MGELRGGDGAEGMNDNEWWQSLTFRVCTNPLDAERAFWHATTGIPYEPEYRNQPWRYDQHAPPSRIYTTDRPPTQAALKALTATTGDQPE